MNQAASINLLASCASPFDGLAYKSLVYVRCHGAVPLYFVAGVQGGPWKAEKALTESHKVHAGPCFYCRKPIGKGKATIDHVEPQALGGSGAIQNLVIACKSCNVSKGHKVLELHNPRAGKAWLEALHRQIEQRLRALPE